VPRPIGEGEANLGPGLPEPGVELTIYPGVGHESWIGTYDLTAGHDIYAWFLGIERAEPQEGDSP
jgi:hypothetical protein